MDRGAGVMGVGEWESEVLIDGISAGLVDCRIL